MSICVYMLQTVINISERKQQKKIKYREEWDDDDDDKLISELISIRKSNFVDSQYLSGFVWLLGYLLACAY